MQTHQIKLQSTPLPMHLLVSTVMPYLAYRWRLLPIMWRLSKTARKLIDYYELFLKRLKWSRTTWRDITRQKIMHRPSSERFLNALIMYETQFIKEWFSGKDFCKHLYGALKESIHKKGWGFFIFYSRLEDYNLKPRKFLTEHLKYASIRVGDRARIGIVVDPTKKKINLLQSYKKVRGIYRIHVIAEFWLIRFDSREIKFNLYGFRL